jgi:acetate---CoA ligase (ADP-forming)
MFAPSSIAVVGASVDETKAGGAMITALAAFPGRLFPVNPRATHIGGVRAYPRIADIDEIVDLAVVVTPAPTVPEIVSELADAGVGAAVICAGGFSESGAEGAELQRRLADVIGSSSIRLLGPNTSGFINPGRGVFANFMPAVSDLRPGAIGIVAQSGGVNLMLSFLAHAERRGISLAVGLGNAVDVGFADVLAYLAADPETKSIAIHVEGVADGREFITAVAAVAEMKPVVALKVGRSDVGDFARSHTGALTGSWALTRSALQQAGAVVVSTAAELVDAASALALVRLHPRRCPGFGVVTGQAGPGLLIADQLGSAGMELPRLHPASVKRISTLLPPITFQQNPVDTGRPDTTFPEICETVAADPAIDLLLLYALVEHNTYDIATALAEAARQGRLGPTVFATGGPSEQTTPIRAVLELAGVPTFDSADRATQAGIALAADAHGRQRRAYGELRHVASSFTIPAATALNEVEAKAIVNSMGIATPRGIICHRRQEAHAALAELGPKVVVKVLDARVLHKTDVGAVHVGVSNERELDIALNAIRAAIPDAEGYLIEELAPPGTDLLLGSSRDPSLGPSVLLALGGVDAELALAPGLALAPLSAADARAMIDTLPAAVLHGYRGRPAVPVESLAELLVVTGDLIVSNPAVAEFEINPLRVLPDATLLALDALCVFAPVSAGAATAAEVGT